MCPEQQPQGLAQCAVIVCNGVSSSKTGLHTQAVSAFVLNVEGRKEIEMVTTWKPISDLLDLLDLLGKTRVRQRR